MFLGAQKNPLIEMVLLGTSNICLKIILNYALSVGLFVLVDCCPHVFHCSIFYCFSCAFSIHAYRYLFSLSKFSSQ